jgi:hypothetical protein
MHHLRQVAKRVTEERYRAAMMALYKMNLCFVLIFVMFMLDRVMILTIDWSYSIFYYAAWAFTVLGIYLAYEGYIKPAAS